MNDRCTPATARRLKELGFPQPEAAFGQVWYDAEDNPFLVGNLDSPMWLADAYTYAPTAPDILLHLDSGTYLIRRALTATFEVYDDWRALEDGTPQYVHENPAEACAEAWEAKQKT